MWPGAALNVDASRGSFDVEQVPEELTSLTKKKFSKKGDLGAEGRHESLEAREREGVDVDSRGVDHELRARNLIEG